MFLWLVILCLCCAYAYTRLNRIRRFADKIPGETPWPIIGNALQIGTDTTDLLPKLMKLWSKHKCQLFGVWLGMDYIVFLTEPDDVEIILSNTNNLSKTKDYDFVSAWLGSGLLTSKGSKWRHSRKIITPTFHFKILEQYTEVFNRGSDAMVQKLRDHADGRVLDIYEYVTLCTLDIIAESAMGTKIDAQNHPNTPVVRAIYDMCYCLMQRSFSAWKRFELLFRLSDTYKLQQKALSVISNFNEQVILQRAEILRKKSAASAGDGVDSAEEEDVGTKKKTAFLDMLLTTTVDGKNLPDQMIRDEVATFIFAGHDTTTSALAFSIRCLADHPEEQRKAFEEQQELFGNDKTLRPTNQDLQNMKYLERFIKEVLRLYPSVPMIARETESDTNINGRIVPKGTNIIIFIYAMNRNPKYFPDPEKFDPNRFLPENRLNKHPYENVSFSAGPRNCIGQKFAMLEIKAVLSNILRNYELLPDQEKFVLYSEITLKSKNGIRVRLIPRKKY